MNRQTQEPRESFLDYEPALEEILGDFISLTVKCVLSFLWSREDHSLALRLSSLIEIKMALNVFEDVYGPEE